MIARARLRKGNTASATGVGRLLAQAINTARAAGVTGQVRALRPVPSAPDRRAANG